MLQTARSWVWAMLLCVAANANAMVVAWGDSMTAGSGGTPWTAQFETISGISVLNEGVGGETSTEVKNRMLASPQYFESFSVIWAGRNNYGAPATVAADIAAMVSALPGDQYLVLGLTNGDYGGYEIAGGEGWQLITGINTALAAGYGNHYLDIRSILIEHYDPADPQDRLDVARDVVPGSLRSDQIHLNTRGNLVVAEAVFGRYQQLLAPVPDTGRGAMFALGVAFVLLANLRRPRSRAEMRGSRSIPLTSFLAPS